MHRGLLVVTWGVVVATTGLVVAPGASLAAPTTCLGKPVTIVATRTVWEGTEGDDVVAMEPGAWDTFDARGGNDTICLAIAAGRMPSGHVDAGPGDDTVVNLMPAGTAGATTTVVLGLGSDTFHGADVGETVYAETDISPFDDPYDSDDPYGADPSFTGSQHDVVTGAATVYSYAPVDGPDQDRVSFSTTRGVLYYEGRMGSQGRVDFPDGGAGRILLRGMRRLAPAAPREVLVDNVGRAVSVGGEAVLTWTGDVSSFTLGGPRRKNIEPAVSFIGTDARETVEIVDSPVGDVDLGGGDDELVVNSVDFAVVPRSADGGAGDDSLALHATCRTLLVRLDVGATCDGDSGPLAGFEDAVAEASLARGSLVLVGTSRAERLVGSGQQVTVRAGAGDDLVHVDLSHVARVWAGAGDDRVVADGVDAVVRGQGGSDLVRLRGFGGPSPVPGHTWRQVALGGRGADDLRGTRDVRPDRLVGGPGKDRAEGRQGRRDYCSAEAVRGCERP
jgi:hypothetical protein